LLVLLPLLPLQLQQQPVLLLALLELLLAQMLVLVVLQA
jgi:hypothetical protein